MPTATRPRPRGARPTPRHVLARSTPFQATGPAPAQYLVLPSRLSMWGNDVHGDCVTAEEAFSKACYQPEIFLSDSVVEGWAAKHGVLDGAYLVDVLTWMASAGFVQSGQTYNDGQHYSVDWTDAPTLASAIAQGPVKIGVAATQLEPVVGSANGWVLTGAKPDTSEDHCTALCGYGPCGWLAGQLGGTLPSGLSPDAPGYAMFTWATVGIVDAPSMLAITSEAWLRSPTTVIVGPGPGPAPRRCINLLIRELLSGAPYQQAIADFLACVHGG